MREVYNSQYARNNAHFVQVVNGRLFGIVFLSYNNDAQTLALCQTEQL